MDTEKNNNMSLRIIPANRRMIDEMSSHGLITADAHDYAMSLLYPAHNWGLWVARLLLVLGVSLILSGIVYFFAFNWTKITPEMKLGSIQMGILGCLGASYFYGLARLSGKIMLLSACVLVGVFLSVFGQIYQTGADAYNLFMMWALFILPWVILSEFAALWFVWLVITNVFMLLYWDQAALPKRESEMMIVSYLAIFNLLFLGLREFFANQNTKWLQDQWTRVVLVVSILVYVLIPTIILIVELSRATHAIILGAGLSAIIHVGFYIVYRYKTPDMWGLAATILSGCIILESAIFKALTEVFRHSDAIMYLLMGGITLCVFTLAIIKLRNIAKEMEAHNV
jgi:uncharacterized membrane protein